MNAKLIAIDLDGTTLNSHHQIPQEVKETLQQKRKEGAYVVICTGRPLVGVTDFLEELEFDSDNDYVITFNGALIQKVKSGEIIAKHTLDINDFYRFATLSKKLGLHMHTQEQGTTYTFNRDISKYTIYESYLTKMPLKYRTFDEIPQDIVISKMMLIDEPDLIDKAIPKIPKELFEQYELVRSMPCFFEILNKQASKGNAVKQLADILNIPRENVMAIGDNLNDISMIEYAGLSVAMGNGAEQVKEKAKYITKTNDEHGVAYAIKTWG